MTQATVTLCGSADSDCRPVGTAGGMHGVVVFTGTLLEQRPAGELQVSTT